MAVGQALAARRARKDRLAVSGSRQSADHTHAPAPGSARCALSARALHNTPNVRLRDARDFVTDARSWARPHVGRPRPRLFGVGDDRWWWGSGAFRRDRRLDRLRGTLLRAAGGDVVADCRESA